MRVPLTGIFEIPAPLKAVDQAIDSFFDWRNGKDRNPNSSGVIRYSIPILCHLGGCPNYEDGVIDGQYVRGLGCWDEPTPDEAPNYVPERFDICLRETAHPEMTKIEMSVMGLEWQRGYDLAAAEVEARLGNWVIIGDVSRGRFIIDAKTFIGERETRRQASSHSQYTCFRARVRWQQTIAQALLSYLQLEFPSRALSTGNECPRESSTSDQSEQHGWQGTGGPPRTRRERLQAVVAWDALAEQDRPRQRDWLAAKFGTDSATGEPLVPVKTFQGWRRYLKKSS